MTLLHRRYRSVVFQLLFALAIILPASAQITPVEHAGKAPSDLDQFIPAQTQHWNVPGLAIAVVQNGQVIYSHGFGLRDVKNNLPGPPPRTRATARRSSPSKVGS